MSASSVALLCAGGALGAVIRFWLTRLGGLWFPKLKFPAPTLFVNITGSAALGILFAVVGPELTEPIDAPLLLFGGVGFCGAYTTFSSFCTETVALFSSARPLAALYVLATVVGCIGAFYLPFVWLS